MNTKIAILGPECTGKTTLALQLANYYKGIWVPEYAREYVSNLKRKYNYYDVEHIAKVQYHQINDEYPEANYVFFDTELIITRVWFEVVYQKIPQWLDDAIKNQPFKIYLLTDNSIPWTPEPVRENGGVMREVLFKKYENYLQSYGFNYRIVTGLNSLRLQNAINIINQNEI